MPKKSRAASATVACAGVYTSSVRTGPPGGKPHAIMAAAKTVSTGRIPPRTGYFLTPRLRR